MAHVKESESVQPTRSSWQRELGHWALRLVGLALFVWVLTRVDLAATIDTLSRTVVGWAAAAILMAIPIVSIRAWRLRLILSSFGFFLSMSQALLIRLVGAAAGDLLPGRAGEGITVAYLQRAGYGLRDPALALILDRLFDLLILAVLGVAGLWIIGRELLPQQGTLLIFGLLVAVGLGLAIVGLLVWRGRSLKPGRLLRRLVPARWQAGLDLLLAEPSGRSFTWNVHTLAGVAAASLVAYLFLLLRGYLLAYALDLDLSLFFVAACMAITTLLQLIPINNVLGIGTREVTLIYLFGLVGVPPQAAVSFSLLIVLSLLAQDSVGVMLWWRFPVGTPALKVPTSIDEEVQA